MSEKRRVRAALDGLVAEASASFGSALERGADRRAALMPVQARRAVLDAAGLPWTGSDSIEVERDRHVLHVARRIGLGAFLDLPVPALVELCRILDRVDPGLDGLSELKQRVEVALHVGLQVLDQGAGCVGDGSAVAHDDSPSVRDSERDTPSAVERTVGAPTDTPLSDSSGGVSVDQGDRS